jgi:methylase of polypeptide subunit release factors
LQPGDDEAEALLRLLEALDAAEYDFVPVTPASHSAVVARPDKKIARTLRDVFGWSLPFEDSLLPVQVQEHLGRAGMIERTGSLLKSKVRVGRLCGRLILHSAFPTEDEDAVFLSPDTHRFVAFLNSELEDAAGTRQLVDIGAGPGSGALCAAQRLPGARLTLCDINQLALYYARINARHAGATVETVLGGIEAVEPGYDLAIANPPFMIDEKGRTYRDGGDLHGGALSVEWAEAAMRGLAPGGRLLLYTGAAIVEGRDEVRTALSAAVERVGCTLRYREIDPDIYGEELAKPAYADVERIAAVGAVIEKPA